MVDSVMIIGHKHVTTVIRGTAFSQIGGDYRGIRFQCEFSGNAVNAEHDPVPPKPEIRITIDERTRAPLSH